MHCGFLYFFLCPTTSGLKALQTKFQLSRALSSMFFFISKEEIGDKFRQFLGKKFIHRGNFWSTYKPLSIKTTHVSYVELAEKFKKGFKIAEKSCLLDRKTQKNEGNIIIFPSRDYRKKCRNMPQYWCPYSNSVHS